MIKISYLLLILTFVFCNGPQVKGQSNRVFKGNVVDKATYKPVIGAHIYLKDGRSGSSTDENGFFQILNLNPSIYIFYFSAIGYKTDSVKIDLTKNSFIERTLELKKVTVEIDQLVISDIKEREKTETGIAMHHISPLQISKLPGYGANPDLAQYLQMLPGIIQTGDQGGQLYIRGGSPSMNKFLVDGITVYNPMHSMGLFSVVPSGILESADIYTGGFGASYSGAIASVMNITTKTGNPFSLKANYTIDPFQTSVLAEGPLIKKKKGKEFYLSYILSGRKSLIDQTASYLPYIDSIGIPFSFEDLFGKLSLRGGTGNKLDLIFMKNSDKVIYPGLVDMNWKFYGGGIRATIFPITSKIQMSPYVFYSAYKNDYNHSDQNPSHSYINGFQLGIKFRYIHNYDHFDYGFEAIGNETNTIVSNNYNLQVKQKDFTTDLRFFAEYQKHLGRFIFEGGVNGIYYGSLNYFSPEPRLRVKFQLNDMTSIKIASGLYSQNLMTSHSDRDIVNFFYGFLSSPANLQEVYLGRNIHDRTQKSRHLVLGLETTAFKSINISSEAYLIDYNQLINVNRNRYYQDNEDNATRPEYLKKEFIIEEGVSYGADFQIKYTNSKTQILLVYSISKSMHQDEVMSYVPHYDRRHSFNILLYRSFGRKNSWEFSSKWNFGTGFPFTQIEGYYEEIDPYESKDVYQVNRLNGDLGILLAEYNQGRLPHYHRLDVNLRKRLTFSWGTIQLVASIINVYNRKNLFYIDRITRKTAYQLPVLPTIGFIYKNN